MLMRVESLFAAAVTVIALAGAAAGETAETGPRDFAQLCSPCHGSGGKGDGPAAAALRVRPADLTNIPGRHDGSFPEDMIFETIAGLDMPDAHGTREMPVWGELFVDEAVGDSVSLADAMKASDVAAARITSLVRYIESIQSPR
jgi:mono/diheme cytochrome c family protein